MKVLISKGSGLVVSEAKAAEDCRTPIRFATISAHELPPGLGVRQSSAAFSHAIRMRRVQTRVSSAQRAFTLLEPLIATVAFAIVLAAINTVFYSALRLRNRATEAIEASLPQQQALTIIKRDLANLVVPGGTLAGELQTTSTTNNMAGQGNPTFCTTTGVIDETSPWCELQHVSYVLMQSTNGSRARDLVRVVNRNLLPATGQEQPGYQW